MTQNPTSLAPGSAAPLRIIARADHHISRKNISNGALRVLYRLNEAGYEAFLVGGAVRDLLLDGHPKDFDIATNADPEQVRALFRNCRLIGRRFRLAHVMFGREIVEVATFRGVSEDGSGDRHMVAGRLIRDNVYGSIEEDAIRRDFTVNALYYNIADFSVRDYVGGMTDLESRTLRMIGDPESRYREDPVRMLRAVRLAAKLGFTIAPATAAPLATIGHTLAEAPPARLFDESLKLFLAGHGLAGFRALEAHALLPDVFPATAAALNGPHAAGFRALIEQTLANTDSRVLGNQPVTAAFLFAALLWEPTRATAETMIVEGSEPNLAWMRAAAGVLGAQAKRVAIPRRVALGMEEIWELQPRFMQRTKKRVFRLLAHPRFRAAYDFLVLRAHESSELAESAAWWTEAQQLDHETLMRRLSVPVTESGDDESAPARRKRPRRRRRKRAGDKSPEINPPGAGE
ncbi:MAG TPA: polynucleotide adenylyltransferase PcnB [Rhodanobacteraceae bacterium]|nr:polynucleotide adenylyltransferase PcnB [Rhodanobacteraceae bacterium]